MSSSCLLELNALASGNSEASESRIEVVTKMNGIDEPSSLPVQCLGIEALREAERHKWIESQKRGQDVGESGIYDWYHHYWPVFCRTKRMEHLEGRRRWDVFDDEKCGRLDQIVEINDLLADRILDRVYAGYENLELIQWALDWGLPIDQVVEVLTQVDVNRARLDPSECLLVTS